MICPTCHQENADGAIFCSNCGSSMKQQQSPLNKHASIQESNLSCILLTIWVVATAVLTIAQNLYIKLVDDWYTEGRMVYTVLSILHNLIMILPALAIKNIILKIIGIVVMSILILWWIYMNLEFGLRQV